jgi:hypothetical protein
MELGPAHLGPTDTASLCGLKNTEKKIQSPKRRVFNKKTGRQIMSRTAIITLHQAAKVNGITSLH